MLFGCGKCKLIGETEIVKSDIVFRPTSTALNDPV
jgi:hypothetical protein